MIEHAVQEPPVQPYLDQLSRTGLIVGIIGIVLAIVGAIVFGPAQLFHSYLPAYLWVFGFGVGTLAFAMIHYLGGGRWGAAVGDFLRAGAATWPLLVVLFIPIVVGMLLGLIYPWTNRAAMAKDSFFQVHAAWTSAPEWLIRAIIFFVIMVVLARTLDRWFYNWEDTGDPAVRRLMRNLSGAGMVFVFLGTSFVMFDWVMSLEPDWWSTIYGLLYVVGFGMSGLALTTTMVNLLKGYWPVAPVVSRYLSRDLGSLQIATIILWAYMSFDQVMLIWVGNLNDEIPYYLARGLNGVQSNGWAVVGFLIALLGFAIPFMSLVLRPVRYHIDVLARVTLLIVLVRILQEIWLTEPDFAPVPILYHLEDVATFLALGGIWFWFYTRQLRRRLVVVRPAAIFPVHQIIPVETP